jgi:hypothetical protein
LQDVWEQLGIDPTVDEREIRRAYARRLKLAHPEDDPDGFQRLRAAYEAAMESARWGELSFDEDPADPDTTVEQFDTGQEDREPDEPAQHSFAIEDAVPRPPSLCVPEPGRLLEDLLSILQSQGEHAAIDRLLNLMNSPEMENLETRDDFEILLAKAVSQMDRKPYLLLAKVVDLFNIELRAGLISSRLTYWHASLLSHLETSRCYARLVQTANTECRSADKASTSTILPLEVPTEGQILAARILTGPFDLHKFRSIARRPGKRKLVLNLLARLKANCPDVVTHVLDPQVVGWWEHRAGSRATLVNNAWEESMNHAPQILIISWILAMAAYGLFNERVPPLPLMAGGVLITIACRLGWALFLQNTRIGNWFSRIWQALFSDGN